MNAWRASGGGDWEEANYFALHQLASEGGQTDLYPSCGDSPDDALRLARASAGEAAAARRRVVPSAAPAARSKDREPSVSGAVQRCQSRSMTCAGCGGVFGLGAKIEPRGAGFVHAEPSGA